MNETFKIGKQKAKRIINIGTDEELKKHFDIQESEGDIINVAGEFRKKKKSDEE